MGEFVGQSLDMVNGQARLLWLMADDKMDRGHASFSNILGDQIEVIHVSACDDFAANSAWFRISQQLVALPISLK